MASTLPGPANSSPLSSRCLLPRLPPQVVKEILRYRAPAPMVPQLAYCDYPLSEEYAIPKGTLVFPSINAANMQVRCDAGCCAKASPWPAGAAKVVPPGTHPRCPPCPSCLPAPSRASPSPPSLTPTAWAPSARRTLCMPRTSSPLDTAPTTAWVSVAGGSKSGLCGELEPTWTLGSGQACAHPMQPP